VIDNKRVIPFELLENAIAGDLRCLTERDEGNIHGERERRRIASKRAAATQRRQSAAHRSNRNESGWSANAAMRAVGLWGRVVGLLKSYKSRGQTTPRKLPDYPWLPVSKTNAHPQPLENKARFRAFA